LLSVLAKFYKIDSLPNMRNQVTILPMNVIYLARLK
jgi:hypothetical protein